MAWTLEQPVATWRAIADRLHHSPLLPQQLAAEQIEDELARRPAPGGCLALTFCDETYFRSVYPAARDLGLVLPSAPPTDDPTNR